uniref:non-specific serine/threonine protein kinase n=1 Tax=Pygocentrus nattereri TaxID=42514 RepID=A0AAR2J0R4_PYGNA
WALDRAAHCVRQNIISFNTPLQKEIDRFKRLLRDSETVKELDRTSACRASRSNTLTWDAVFRFLKKYLHKETELLQSGKANVSATTQANRRKKMQEISSLIKYFVRCANKRGPKLKCADLLGHVVEVMQSSFSCAAYGEDYSSMLLKNILSVRKYWCEISQHQWHNLLELYCGLFTGTSRPINRVLVSRIIHTVVQGCCLQTEGLSHTLFSFFSKALSNTREERQLTVLEHLISALNVFLRSVAMNCRRRVCRLGEELLPSVLYVWSQKRPSSTLKEEMVEFFNLQLCVHHPKGAKTLETGAHAEDWVKWQSLLCNLYDVLVDEISHIGSRGKYATGSRHIAVKENLIELTADICHQLFSQDVRVVEVRGAQRDSPQSSKRRRVELGWEVLRDHLQPHHSDFDVIPWLQVTAALTSKYPSMLPAPELLPLLSLLCQLLGEQQRRGERGPYVLRCLRQVALCPAACSQGSGAQQCELGRLWSKVWAMAIRGVSSAQTEALCLELLRTMVQCSLVPVDREFWKLFSSAICKPSTLLSSACVLLSSLSPPEPPESKNILCEIEALYLQFSFDDTTSCSEIREDRTCGENPQLTVIGALRTHLEQSLQSVAEHLLNSYSPDSSVTPPVCMVRCLRLLTGVLGAFVCIGLFTAEDACHCALFQKAKVDHAKGVIFNVSTITRSLFTKALPGRLLTELSDICKLMVSYCRNACLLSESPLSQDLLTNQDLAFLSTLEFLSLCVSFDMGHGLAFKPTEIRRRLLKLLEQIDCSKPLVIVFFVCLHRDVCSLYRQDQEVCSSILLALLPCVRCLGRVRCSDEEADEMNHVRGALLRVVSGFRCATKKVVRAPPAVCADPCCKWAVLSLREEELPVCAVLPSHLADPHHHVRMLTTEWVGLNCCRQNGERKKMLPLKHQQTAFENVYLKAQEGMKIQHNHSAFSPEDLPDETFNRRATLLKSLSVVMCCSPVCEKQALFALLQSYNSIEEQLIKKVLGGVSRSLGYRSSKAFVWSHLYYLVAEWLGQREKDSSYTLQSFPYTLLNYSTLEEFYRLSYHVLIPHLVFLNDFEQVKSIGSHLKEDWRKLLANCFPKIMVNILPHFALPGQDAHEAQQREKAYRVYDLLKDSDCLGKQQIDSLIWGNLAEIVVELLMTLYEGAGAVSADRGDLQKFIGELDPAPNPPFFSSSVIRDTLDHLSKCHSATHKSLVAILSKTPMSMQKILASICQRAAETTNAYERHRILMMYHLFVNLLLREVKDGLGGSWAFVLRDVIYTLIHHINSRSAHTDEVSTRSLALCCDLLTTVCQTAIHFCDDALETHLQVIVGTLTALVTQQSAISQQVLRLLKFLVIDNPDNRYLRRAIPLLEPFPDQPAFRELRAAQHALKYSSGAFSLRQEVEHFLSVTSCDSLPLTRLEGLKDLKRQLHTLKQQIEQLLKESDPAGSVLVKLVLNLLQLCKLAANHPGGRDILEAVGGCLGVLGPVDLSTIALHHGKDQIYSQAAALCPDALSQWIFIILSCMNNALTHHSISVRQAAAVCLKDVLATQSGLDFWEMYKSQGDPMLLYLSPFRSTVKSEVAPASRDRLDSVDLWLVQPGRHKDWLRNLCIALLDSGGVQNEALLMTRPLCEVKTDFCQKVLPLFIHDVLLGDRSGSWRELLSTHIQDFFSSCSRPAKPSSRPTTPTSPDSGVKLQQHCCPDKCSLRTMLAVINYLRQQGRPAEYGTVCESNFWLDLNYLEVALAAQLCSAHFTALLYSEIYVDNIRTNMEEKRRYLWSLCKLGRTSSRPLEFETPALRSDLLIEVYRSIGEPDSLYGCGGGKLINPLTRIRTYEHEAMWGKALASYDLHTNLPEVTRQVGIVEGLQNLGLCSILSTYLAGLEREVAEWSPELRELRFQAAWRSTQWDQDLSEKLNLGFNESIFTSLQALKDKDFTMFGQTLKYARGSGVDELCRGSLEAVSSLYPALCSLQMIEELQSVRPLFSGPVSDSDLVEVYSKWHQHLDLLTDSDFSLVEPILALRSSIQETLLTCEADPGRKTYLSSAYSSHLMELCRLARSAGNTQLAERAVFQMKQHSGVSSGSVSSWAWQLEEAQVFWVKKEQGLALGLLRQMIDKLQDLVSQVEVNPAVVPVYAECLRLCGSWLSETCLESPAVILDSYLERAVEVIVGHGGAPDPKLQSQKTQAFLSLARFSDAQYQGIENYMRSSEFENKQALLEKAKEEVDLMKERKVTNNRYTVKVQRELELDVRAMSNLQADRRRFLLKAVENYIRCLELGEEHDTWVFRLASLWLENADVRNVNDMMKEGVKNIPSYKFLPLMYQLAARMGTKVSNPVTSEDVGFHTVLTELICQACMDHPHHTLFIILALVNANKDESFSRIRLSKSSARQPSPLDLERAEVALKIMNEIRKRKAQMIRGIETLCSAYITLAYMDASRHKTEKKAIPIPVDQPIMQIKDLDDVIIPTMEIKVDPSGRYEDLVTISSFKPHFHLAGGVNLPKIIDCVGSDGKSRRQLVKGQDDLRQDAVMQQVFHMCSMLLQRNTETRKRKLNIRRYKVVPFSQRSGVLEWCSGTVPIGEFLVDPQKGAHKRFRPQDWTNLSCRKKMMDAQRMGFDAKLQAFTEVCQNFRPVFRYFCMERFLDPAVWMEKRLAYTRSVATSSIVGYIVGLGDRHIQNILIDEQTAELVHIDLGVAFEQGKILPTPETVPFRLSRDIVDGMGITGVEGVFRRCCEKTMEVMRSSQEVLLTIVEVLLYDPLFDWTMNPLKAFYLQQQQDEQAELNATLNPTSDSQSFNKVAERVLLRLQEKLKGVEEGAVLSVGGQVNLLIQQAMDSENLSRLFPGWQAWV